jgi:hypothetical protein
MNPSLHLNPSIGAVFYLLINQAHLEIGQIDQNGCFNGVGFVDNERVY